MLSTHNYSYVVILPNMDITVWDIWVRLLLETEHITFVHNGQTIVLIIWCLFFYVCDNTILTVLVTLQ